MAATADQLEQALESFYLLFNGVVIFRKFNARTSDRSSRVGFLVMSCGYTLIESGGVRSQNAGHSVFKTLLILSKSLDPTAQTARTISACSSFIGFGLLDLRLSLCLRRTTERDLGNTLLGQRTFRRSRSASWFGEFHQFEQRLQIESTGSVHSFLLSLHVGFSRDEHRLERLC